MHKTQFESILHIEITELIRIIRSPNENQLHCVFNQFPVYLCQLKAYDQTT